MGDCERERGREEERGKRPFDSHDTHFLPLIGWCEVEQTNATFTCELREIRRERRRRKTAQINYRKKREEGQFPQRAQKPQ